LIDLPEEENGTTLFEPGLYYIISKDTGKCLQVDGGALRDDKPAWVKTFHCHGSGQSWHLYKAGTGVYQIKPSPYNMCWDVWGGSNNRHDPLQVFQCGEQKNQQFKFYFEPDDSKYNYIYAVHSGGVLEVRDGNKEDNGFVDQIEYSRHADNQLWKIVKADFAFPEDSPQPQPHPHPSGGDSGSGTTLLLVQSITISPNSISLGSRTTLTVTLNRPTEYGMMIIPTIDSNGADATLAGPYPIVVNIPKGSRTGTYTIQTQRVNGAATRINFYVTVGFDKIGDHLDISP